MTPPVIRLAHSPDADDAFMFWAMAAGRIDTGGRRYVHELGDIESLNRRALSGELEVTAVSFHAYAYLADRYALLAHGASFGDRYGPRIVAREPLDVAEAGQERIENPHRNGHVPDARLSDQDVARDAADGKVASVRSGRPRQRS